MANSRGARRGPSTFDLWFRPVLLGAVLATAALKALFAWSPVVAVAVAVSTMAIGTSVALFLIRRLRREQSDFQASLD